MLNVEVFEFPLFSFSTNRLLHIYSPGLEGLCFYPCWIEFLVLVVLL